METSVKSYPYGCVQGLHVIRHPYECIFLKGLKSYIFSLSLKVLKTWGGYSHILGHYICATQLPLFLAIFPPDLPANLKDKHLTCPQNFEFSNSPRYGQLKFCLFSMNSGYFFFIKIDKLYIKRCEKLAKYIKYREIC